MQFPVTKLVVAFSLTVSGSTIAQQRVVDVGKEDVSPMSNLFFSIGGEPYSLARYVQVVEGSPFFSEKWLWGDLVLSAGRKYENIQLKIDLIADEVHYKDSAGNPFIATARLREIWLRDVEAGKKYHFVHSSFIGSGNAESGWHQLLAEGRAMLFKRHVKEINETKPYGSSTTEQRISTTSRYFILYNNSFFPLKSISAIPEVLSDQKDELLRFISSNKLKGKSDADYISLVSFYNNLPVQ